MMPVSATTISIVIIDDEFKSTENLKILLDQLDLNIKCLGVAHSVMDGIKLIKSVKPELVFLDINMPQHSGFDLLEAIDSKEFSVVFTTAHEEYAIQSIKHQVFDYLLKPIDLDELQTCLLRFLQEEKSKKSIPDLKQIKVSVKDGLLFLKQKEIIRLEADGSYCQIFMKSGERHTISKNLKAMEEMLDTSLFYRCHNSHIINLNYVKKFLSSEGYFVKMEDDAIVEVSRSKKEDLLERL